MQGARAPRGLWPFRLSLLRRRLLRGGLLGRRLACGCALRGDRAAVLIDGDAQLGRLLDALLAVVGGEAGLVGLDEGLRLDALSASE